MTTGERGGYGVDTGCGVRDYSSPYIHCGCSLPQCRIVTRITAAHGVQEHAYITLGGIEQYVQIRGEDRRNPVILCLHGGPGFPLTYMTGHYQAELERDYTVAVWEQRGCGRTLHRNPNVSNPTIDELLSDVDELVDHLRKRFDRDAIILVGQSWGRCLRRTIFAGIRGRLRRI